MIFYKIKLNSFPKIRFASTTCTDKYKNIITYRKNIIEIGVSGGAFEAEEGDRKFFIPAENFNLLMPDMNIKTCAADDKIHYRSSAAIEGDFDFERIDCEDIDEIRRIIETADNEIVLPFFMELNTDYTDVERLFKMLISYYLKESAAGRMCVISVWCEIAAWIDTEFRRRIMGEKHENTAEYYSRKTRRYIETHYSERLTVKDIAGMLNISPNYLSGVFKKSTGKTLTEFIAHTKLAHARRLVYEGNLDFERIAKEVGVCNEKYLNKLFKKYYGTSIQKCSMIDHEISLYHDKPWDVEELTEDIFE